MDLDDLLHEREAEPGAGLLLDLNRVDGLTLVVVTHSAELAGRMGKTLELRNGNLQMI